MERFLSTVYIKPILSCPQGHRFCERCIQYRFYQAENICNDMLCFAYGGCNAYLDSSRVLKNAPNDLKEFCKDLFKGQTAQFCPQCKQNTAFSVDDGNKVQCNDRRCLQVTCLRCNEICSGPRRHQCDPFNACREHVCSAMKSLIARQCPKCRRWIHKYAGCNHMTCPCGAQFCYLCGGDYTNDHFSTSNCLQFTNDKWNRWPFFEWNIRRTGNKAFRDWLQQNSAELTDDQKRLLNTYEVDAKNFALKKKSWPFSICSLFGWK
jgi:hypothetical protein